MEIIQQLLDNSQVPALTAFLLGLLTALSPCPLVTNITAIGFIARNGGGSNEAAGSRSLRVVTRGLLYTLGRSLAYTLLGAALIFIIRKGVDTFDLQQSVSEWGELILGPALIIIGALMMVGEFVELGGKFGFSGSSRAERLGGPVGSLLLGILFAMAFCPTSGLLYFGMLIPMSATASGGYLLPLAFAVGTSLPVLCVAWVLAYSVHSMGRLMGKIAILQRWFNRIVAILFIGVGFYYSITIFA